MPEYVNKNTGGKTFGSYRLGVHGPGADIELSVSLLTGMRTSSSKLLNILKNEREVTNLHDVKDAFVPVLKMIYWGIVIDLLFARLKFKTIDENLTKPYNDTLLKNY